MFMDSMFIRKYKYISMPYFAQHMLVRITQPNKCSLAISVYKIIRTITVKR